MTSVGVVVHHSRPDALASAAGVVARLADRGISVWLDESAAARLERPDLTMPAGGAAAAQLLVSLGGDGTILKAARLAAPAGTPILGVHMGRFGFIAEIPPDSLFPELDRALAGEARIEERLMVHGQVWRGEELIFESSGLNEALVRSGYSHLLHLRTRLGGVEFARYPADGIIVATPTGSTGYALSAGGPIMQPTVQAFVMAPICPHTLNARPLVLPCDETIEIDVETGSGEAVFAVDGGIPVTLAPGDRVLIRRAEAVTRLVVLDQAGFYRKIRDRYLYGERLNS